MKKINNIKSILLIVIISTLIPIAIITTYNLCISNTLKKLQSIINSNIVKLTIIIFIITYTLIIIEEFIKIKKSAIAIISSGLIWTLISISTPINNESFSINKIIKNNLLMYSELLLFLIVAITYINSLKDRNVFKKIKYLIIIKKLTYKQIYFITGIIAFFVSPIADNLTTSLIFCSIIISLGKNNEKFINLGCINIIIAANAGGVFSPFGDITTLMIWQSNLLKFDSFFKIFLPSMVSFLIPSLIMSFNVQNENIILTKNKKVKTKVGAIQITILFFFTIIMSMIFQHYLNIPAVIGMLTGLGLLQLYENLLKKKIPTNKFNLSKQISNIDWDTLIFFYGIMLCIEGISALGLLNDLSSLIYTNLGKNLPPNYQQTPANILIGLISSIIDNIPIVYAILSMKPTMNEGQWLLVTLTSGIGGSLLSIGSASGVAVMGQAKGIYTFFSHLKWSWAILLGYSMGIIVHIYINKNMFTS
ncbi:MAG TPA: sodium:proton antiporter NhaD [Candidatus Azoamicus sp. OHIO1]